MMGRGIFYFINEVKNVKMNRVIATAFAFNAYEELSVGKTIYMICIDSGSSYPEYPLGVSGMTMKFKKDILLHHELL
jgi:hypothetical protein